MKNLGKEKEKEELLLFCRQKLEEGLKNMKRTSIGTVKKWGNREYVKVERGWVRLIYSKNTGS